MRDVREREERRATGPAPAQWATLMMLAVLLVGLFESCSSPEPSTRSAELALRAQEQRAAELQRSGEPVAMRQSESALGAELRGRLPALELLGGPSAWGELEPQLGPDLLGAEQDFAPITLQRALLLAAEHNLGLRFARLRPEIAAEGLLFEEALFDPVFFGDLEYEDFEQPRPVPVLGGVQLGTPLSAAERARVQAGVRQLLHNGATIAASTFLERYDNQTPGIEYLPDPAWRSGLALDLVQPLLRGAGSAATDVSLELARNVQRRSEEELRTDLLIVAALVEQSFWDLREARGRLQIQQRLTQQGEEVERVLRERRDFDVQPAEYADALATLEQRRADLVRARSLLRAASDRLKSLLDAPGLGLDSEDLLLALDEFREEPAVIELAEAISTAIERRPELRAALSTIEDADLRLALAKSLRRPRLDLVGRVEVLGEDDSLGDGYGSLAEDDLLSYLVALRLEIPFGNRGARADVRRAQLEGRAALLRHDQELRNVVLEVKTALRDLVTSFELIGAARSFRIAQSENLRELLLEKERRRSLTPEFLRLEFDRQDRLARAQLDELQAIANYNRALAAYHRATGTGPFLAGSPN